MALTNEKKVSSDNYILDDIVFSILSKLSVKSVKRFSCVCQSWSLLFQNSIFIDMFRNNLISKSNQLSDDCLILNQCVSSDFNLNNSVCPDYNYNLYLLSGDTFENKVKLNFPPPFDNIQWNDVAIINILGSPVNGILCIYDRCKNTKPVLWNPVTKEVKFIPPSLGELEISPRFKTYFLPHGFGFDHVSGDYKVIQHVHYNIEFGCESLTSEPFWEIYSLKNNSWKKLDFDMPTSYPHGGNEVYLNGICYWTGMENASGEICLVSFDLCDEFVLCTPLPLYVHDGLDDFDIYLAMLNGYVAIISNITKKTSLQISILGEFGVEESWIRLFNFEPFSGMDYPIGVAKGKYFFRKVHGELACFDLTTGKIEKIGFKGKLFNCQMLIYKENLHPIGGINN